MHSSRWVRPCVVLFAGVLVVALAACGGGKKNARSTTTTTATSSVTSIPASTTTNTESLPTISLPCEPIPIPHTPVSSPAPAHEVLLTAVQETGDRCVDHVVFGFKAVPYAPGYSVTYANGPFTEDASGDPVNVAGTAFVVVKIQPGYGYDYDTGTSSYTGPKRITPPGANHIREIVETGDFEGVLTWVIGLDAKRPFSVQATPAPQTQLVVTIS